MSHTHMIPDGSKKNVDLTNRPLFALSTSYKKVEMVNSQNIRVQQLTVAGPGKCVKSDSFKNVSLFPSEVTH